MTKEFQQRERAYLQKTAPLFVAWRVECNRAKIAMMRWLDRYHLDGN